MKKIYNKVFILISVFMIAFVTYCAVGAQESEPNDSIKELLTSYYNDGIYIKESKINLNSVAQDELVSYFHAECNILERTTYYNGDELLMSAETNENGELVYSYYGTAYDGETPV